MKVVLFAITWPSQLELQYTLTASLQRSKTPPMSVLYMTLNNHGEAPVMLKLKGMQSTPSLLLLPGSLWPGVVASDRVLSIGQIELKYVLMLN